MTTIFVIATGASSQAKPGDFSATNEFSVIGGGASGFGTSGANQAGGGGAGAFSKSTNITVGGGVTTFFFSVGAGGAGIAAGSETGNSGADSWIRFDGTNAAPTTTAQGVLAKAGLAGSVGGTGGL